MKKIKIGKEDLLKQVAKEFVRRGYKVHWWKKRDYNYISKEDFTTILISKDGNRTANVGQSWPFSYSVGWNYIPNREHGTGCAYKSELTDKEQIIKAVEYVLDNNPWVKGVSEKGALEKHLKDYDFFSQEPLRMEDFKNEEDC